MTVSAPACPPGDRFRLGRLLMTRGALQALEVADDDPFAYFGRHASGDWGEVDEEDERSNDLAVEQGRRILSAYRTSQGERIWLITEADRSVTTILLPEEY